MKKKQQHVFSFEATYNCYNGLGDMIVAKHILFFQYAIDSNKNIFQQECIKVNKHILQAIKQKNVKVKISLTFNRFIIFYS